MWISNIYLHFHIWHVKRRYISDYLGRMFIPNKKWMVFMGYFTATQWPTWNSPVLPPNWRGPARAFHRAQGQHRGQTPTGGEGTKVRGHKSCL